MENIDRIKAPFPSTLTRIKAFSHQMQRNFGRLLQVPARAIREGITLLNHDSWNHFFFLFVMHL